MTLGATVVTVKLTFLVLPDPVFAVGQLDPVATDHFGVGHEPDLEVDVGLESLGRRNAGDVAPAQQTLGGCDEPRYGNRDLDKGPQGVPLKLVDGGLVEELHVEDGVDHVVLVGLHVLFDGVVEA